jgi:hypothetical protein
MKACEAVSTRIKKLNETDGESNLSMRQIGLRRLLSGINAHLSSCVVSATMAWYLVTHGTRFHFSHEFKPLLLSQLESWYEGKGYSRRIRKKKRPENHMTHTTVALEDKFARILRYGLTVMLITIFSDLLFQNLTI